MEEVDTTKQQADYLVRLNKAANTANDVLTRRFSRIFPLHRSSSPLSAHCHRPTPTHTNTRGNRRIRAQRPLTRRARVEGHSTPRTRRNLHVSRERSPHARSMGSSTLKNRLRCKRMSIRIIKVHRREKRVIERPNEKSLRCSFGQGNMITLPDRPVWDASYHTGGSASPPLPARHH